MVPCNRGSRHHFTDLHCDFHEVLTSSHRFLRFQQVLSGSRRCVPCNRGSRHHFTDLHCDFHEVLTGSHRFLRFQQVLSGSRRWYHAIVVQGIILQIYTVTFTKFSLVPIGS